MVKLNVNTNEKVIYFSNGEWLPMSYLTPLTLEYNREWKSLFMKEWFTEEMFFECIELVVEAYKFSLNDILFEAGRWNVLKRLSHGEVDVELNFYLKKKA